MRQTIDAGEIDVSKSPKPREDSETEQATRIYTIQFAPVSPLGRLAASLVFAGMVFLALFFFYLFLVIAGAIIALAILVGIFKHITRGDGPASERSGRGDASCIEAERSAEDGVFRPKDSSDP